MRSLPTTSSSPALAVATGGTPAGVERVVTCSAWSIPAETRRGGARISFPGLAVGAPNVGGSRAGSVTSRPQDYLRQSMRVKHATQVEVVRCAVVWRSRPGGCTISARPAGPGPCFGPKSAWCPRQPEGGTAGAHLAPGRDVKRHGSSRRRPARVPSGRRSPVRQRGRRGRRTRCVALPAGATRTSSGHANRSS